MGYTLNADYRARKNPHPAPKNRVGDFFSCSYEQGVSYAPATPVNTGENQIHGYENASGIPHYRARYYDPGLGRFISRDPIEIDSGDFNFYRYVENQPGFYVDPSGYISSSEYSKIQSRLVLATQECIKALGIGVVEKAAFSTVYFYWAESQIYAGRTINPGSRESAHLRKIKEEAKDAVRESFQYVFISKHAYKHHLQRVRELEQFMINFIERNFGKGDLRNARNEIRGGISPCDFLL